MSRSALAEAPRLSKRECLCALGLGAAGLALGGATGGSAVAGRPGEPIFLGTLAPGSWITVMVGGVPYVVRRLASTGAEEWVVHEAVCTHAGCKLTPMGRGSAAYVCFCHGSLFDAQGAVIEGPAQAALRRPRFEMRDGSITILL